MGISSSDGVSKLVETKLCQLSALNCFFSVGNFNCFFIRLNRDCLYFINAVENKNFASQMLFLKSKKDDINCVVC